MLEQRCVVTDRWTANQCLDQKEELVYMEALKDEGELDESTRTKKDLLNVVRFRAVI